MKAGVSRLAVWLGLAFLASAIPLVPAQQAQEVAPKRVNLNTATVEELKQLPGIGPSLAQRIVAHREKNGRFRRIEELLIVRGINRKKFEALRSLIYVEKPPLPGVSERNLASERRVRRALGQE